MWDRWGFMPSGGVITLSETADAPGGPKQAMQLIGNASKSSDAILFFVPTSREVAKINVRWKARRRQTLKDYAKSALSHPDVIPHDISLRLPGLT